MLRSLHVAVSILVGACLGLTLLPASSVMAQGPPDILWMRGSHFGSMGGIHFTPDSQLMVTTPLSNLSPEVKIHHLPDGLMIKSFRAYTLSLFGSALSPVGDVLATLGEDADGSRHLRAWKIPSGALLWDTTVLMDFVAGESTDTVAFSSDGNYVYAWATSWNPGSGVRAPVSMYATKDMTIGGNAVKAGTQVAWALGSYNDNGNIINYSYGDTFTLSANQILIGPPDPSAEMMTSSLTIDSANSGQPSGAWTGDGVISPVTYAGNWGVNEGISAAYSPKGDLIAAMGFKSDESGWMALWPTHSGSTPLILNYLGNNNGAQGNALRWYNEIRWPVDGTLFAAGQNLDQGNTSQSYVDRYDITTGQVTQLWSQSVVNPPFMEASPDGSLVAVAATDGRDSQSLFLHILDGTTGTPLQYTDSQGASRTAFDFHGNSVVSTAWSADGTRIATSSAEGTVRVWRASDGALLCSMVHPGTASSDIGPIHSLSFSPDGYHLVATYQAQYSILEPVQILDWDITNLDAPTLAWSVPYAVQPQHAGNFWPVAYSPDGKMVAAIEGDPSNKYVIRMRNPVDGTPLYHGDIPYQSNAFADEYGAVMAFSPDSQSLAIYVANPGTAYITIYRVSDLTSLRSTTGQIASVSSLCWSPDNKKLAYGVAGPGNTGGIVLLDATRDGLPQLWSQQTSSTCPLTDVTALAIDPCGQYLVAECPYNTPDGPPSVFFCRMSDGKPMKRYDQEVGTGYGGYANDGAVQSFSFSPDGQFYAYPRWDNGVVVARHPLWTPPAIKSLNFTASITGGHTENGSATLECPAPIGGVTLQLSVDNPSLVSLDPSSVFIPTANTLSPSFQISAMPVTQDVSATITAAYTFTDSKGHTTKLTRSKKLTVKAPALSKLTLSSSKVKGGSSLIGTITLTGPTAADTTITVVSSNTAIATPVDANRNPTTTVTVPAGAKTVQFTILTYAVSQSTNCTLSATLGTTRPVSLTVTP